MVIMALNIHVNIMVILGWVGGRDTGTYAGAECTAFHGR